MCGNKTTGQTNSSQTYTPPPEVLANYKQVTDQAKGVAATPYNAYGGQLVADVNGQQSAGIGGVNSAANTQTPYNAGAGTLAVSSASTIDPTKYSAEQIQQYENPYQSDVVDATMAQIRNQNRQQAADLQGNAVSAGAFGGDRAGVAQAALAGQQDIASNATLANLNSSNFLNAQGEFNTQQGVGLGAAQNTAARQLAASQQYANLGQLAQTEGLTGANAQINAGTLQQANQQAKDTAAYNQFLQQQAYPFQTTGWLANIVEGIGSQSGGTTTGQQTQQGGSGLSSVAGGLLGLASFLKDGGRVTRKASGGGLSPYDPQVQPNGGLGGGTYVAPVNLAVGHTMPPGMSAPSGAGQDPNKSMMDAAKSVQGLGNTGVGDKINDFFQDLPDSFGGSGMSATDMGLGFGGGLYARGGSVPHFDAGGDVTPDALWADADNPHGTGPRLQPNDVTPLTQAVNLPTPEAAMAARYAQGNMPAPQQDGITPQQRLAVAMGAPMPASAEPSGSYDYDMPTNDPIAASKLPTSFADRLQDYQQDFTDAGHNGATLYLNERGGVQLGLPPSDLAGFTEAPVMRKQSWRGLTTGLNGIEPVAPAGLAPTPAGLAPTPDAGLAKLRTAMGGSDPAPRDPNAAYGGLGDLNGLAVAGDAPTPPSRPKGLGVEAPTMDAAAPGGLGAAVAPSAPVQLSGAEPAQPEQFTARARPNDIWAAPAYQGPPPKGPAPNPADYPVTQQGQEAFIRDYAAHAGGRGIDPNFAISVGNAEGLRAISPSNPNGASTVDIDPRTGKPFSFGAFQLNVRNGLGNAARAAGIDPTDPAQANAANKFAMDYMATHDIRPWRSDKAVEAYQSGAGFAAAPASRAIAAAPTGLGGAQTYRGAPLTADSPVASTDARPAAPDTGGGLLGLHFSDAARQGMLAAGLGMMSGTSMNPFVNIGQGGLGGLKAYNDARKLQSEIGLQGAQAGEINTRTGLMPAKTAAEINRENAQSGLLGAQTQGAQTEADIKKQQLNMMLGLLGGHAAEGAQKADAIEKVTAPATARNGTPAAPPQKQVDPRSDPFALRAEADRLSLGGPMFKDRADRMYAQAAAIMSGEQQVQFTDGTTGYYPGVGEAKAEQAKRLKTAEAEASVPATIATKVGETNYETNNKIKTETAATAENGQQMLSQALALRNLMFDPKTGQPLVNSGPYGDKIAGIAATLKQFGIGDGVIQALTGTDPNNAQAIEKLRTSLGSESARADLAGSQIRVAEFQRFLAATPNAQLLPAAYKYIIDKTIIPKAQQQIQEYETIKGLDPQKDDLRTKLFEFRQDHPYYAGAPPVEPADRVKGVIYLNPRGDRARWTGTGWQPIK